MLSSSAVPVRGRRLTLLAAVGLAVLAGSGGYVAGRAGGGDRRGEVLSGRRSGHVAGEAAGFESGYQTGVLAGERAGYRLAYGRAYGRARQRALGQ